LNRLFAAFLLCFAVWSLSDIFIHNHALSKGTIVLCNKFGAVGWIGFSAFFLWFCLVFTEKKKILKIKLFYIIIFCLPLLLIYRHWTGFLVKDYNKEYFGWAIVWAETAWTYLFYLYLVSFMGIGLYVVFDFMKKTEDMVRKKQAQIIFGAAILPLIMGMSTEIILPKINIFVYPGIGSSVTLIWALGVVYSMIRYKFLTITPSNAAENIISTMAESLILLDAVGIIVDINKATEDLLGYQKNEVKGKSFDFLLPEHLQKTLLDRIIKGENIKSYDIVFKTKHLENILVSFSNSLLKDSVGNIAGIIGVATDITERKKVEEALRESEERYRTLVENVPVAVYRTIPGPKGKFLMGNPTCLKIYGLDSEEELKEIAPADVYMNTEERKAFSDNLLANGSVTGVELALRKKDGTPFWGSVTARVVYDKNGKNPYFDCTVMDITERKKAEEALRESEERYRTLVQNVPIGVYRTTPGPKGEFLIANPTCVKMFGLESEEELKKISVADVYMNPEQRKVFSDNFLAKGSASGLELPLRRRDGTVFWASVTARVMYDENGKNPYFDCTIMDISERKKVEEALRESEERYRTLVENVPVAVYRTIPGPKGEFLMGNPTCLKIFGLESEEELKKIAVADVHINSKNRKAFSDNLLAKGSVTGVELPLRKKDGTAFWGSVTARVVYDENGKNPYFDCTIMDITERKKLQDERESLIKKLEENQRLLKKQNRELEDSQRAIKNVAEDLRKSKQVLEERKEDLEKINKELDDFTYIISHDLKEPLRSIDAFSKFIRDDYNDKLDEEGRNYLERVRANASRMQSLIEDLLEISRIERKKNPFEEVETEELVNEAKLRLEYAIRNKNAEIVVRDKLPKVFCDRVRLAGVFVNLISNAIKFNDKPNPCIEINCSPKGIFYEFYVKDNGPGIEERYFDKIFEIFQRLGKRGDREGTGAGLTIVKKIVEMHKGRIWVESKIGEGATFYFTIPKEKEFILGKKKIGEILVEKKLVAEEEVKKALEEQERMG